MVKPKVFLIASTQLNDLEVERWMKEVGGQECLSHVSGDDGEKLCELAGRNCYKSFAPELNKNVTKIRKDSYNYHENVLKSKHGSVLEHATATFAFENVSRVFTHELVRHRAGMAFSQQSLRYVRLDEIDMWVPPEIREHDTASHVFQITKDYLQTQQRILQSLFDFETIPMKEKKKLTSAFRRLAPMGLATSIVATFNLRALRWVLQMRTSVAAEVEIRTVFCEVYDLAKEKWPMLFQDFVKVSSDDGLFEAVPHWGKV